MPKQYTLAGLAAALNSTLTFPLFFHTTVTATDGADTLTLAMTNSPGLTGVEGTWGNGGNVTNVSGFVYTNGTNNFEFTEWDAATDFGKMRRTHTNGNTEMYSYVRSGSVQKLIPDDGQGTEYTLPTNFAFVGAYPESNDELRILTDDELRLLDADNNWDISGTDWVYPKLFFDGAWTDVFGHDITVTSDPTTPHWYYWTFDDSSTGGNQTPQRNRFYALGSQVVLDSENSYFPTGASGVADTVANTITWQAPGIPTSGHWQKTSGFGVSNDLITITAVNPDGLTLSRHYDIDFSNLLPAGRAPHS